MTHRRLLVSLLALTLVIQGVAWVSVAEDTPDEKVRSELVEGAPAKAVQPGERAPEARVVRVITLSETVAAKKPEAALPRPDVQAPQVKAVPMPEQAAVPDTKQDAPSVATPGEWPAIELVYDAIGFDRYMAIAERIGRFHLLMEGRALGPAVSLRERLILQASTADFATERPYLVSDPAILERLPTNLPAGANRKGVLLLLRDWADRALWTEIRQVAAEKRLTLPEIVRVNGFYAEDWLGIYVMFEAAITRAEGRSVTLGRRLRLPG